MKYEYYTNPGDEAVQTGSRGAFSNKSVEKLFSWVSKKKEFSEVWKTAVLCLAFEGKRRKIIQAPTDKRLYCQRVCGVLEYDRVLNRLKAGFVTKKSY
jgi:hypothetical protein